MADTDHENAYRRAAAVVDSCPLQLPKGCVGMETALRIQRYRRGDDAGKRTAEDVTAAVARIDAARKKAATLRVIKSAATLVQRARAGDAVELEELGDALDLRSSLPASVAGSYDAAIDDLRNRAAGMLLQSHDDDGWATSTAQWHVFDHAAHPDSAFLVGAFYATQSKRVLQQYQRLLVDAHKLHDAVSTSEVSYSGALAEHLAALTSGQAFPACLISSACQDTVQLLSELVDAVEVHTLECSNDAAADSADVGLSLILQIVRLWGATARIHWPKFDSEGLSIGQLIHNNTLYLAAVCRVVAERWQSASCEEERLHHLPSGVRTKIAQTAAALRGVEAQLLETSAAAVETLSAGVMGKIAPLLTTLEEGLLGLSAPTALDGTFSAVMVAMKAAQAPWKEYLPICVFREHLGRWATAVHQVLVTSIPQMSDIQTKDANVLIENLSQLHLFECWFVDERDLSIHSAEEASDAISGRYLPHRVRLEAILSVLTADRMIDLMELYNRGLLHALSKEELVNMIKALYEPSMKRTQNIRTILADGASVEQ